MFVDYVPVIQALPVKMPFKVDVLRLDLIDPEVSGNKLFKLKHHVKAAVLQGHQTLLTFGGAYSNHIAATAAYSKKSGVKSIGVIRGEDTSLSNPTLTQARSNGMELFFVSREQYRKKSEQNFLRELEKRFGAHYLVPEGGSGKEGALGCREIVLQEWKYDYIFCACGTGTTYAGLVSMPHMRSKIIGISVLKGLNKLPQEVTNLLNLFKHNNQNLVAGNEAFKGGLILQNAITNNYAFNGYAAFHPELINFKNQFEELYQLPLDYVYTAKLFYGAFDLMQNKKLKENASVLIIHSGGLQGNRGFEERYKLTTLA